MTRRLLPLAALALMLLAVLPSPAFAPLTMDLRIAREVICAHETRGESRRGRDPDQAISSAQALGRCQIKPSTGRQYRPLPIDLGTVLSEIRWRPEGIADDILADCATRAHPHLGPYGLGVLYYQGCRYQGPVRGLLHDYARQIAHDYANAIYARRLKDAGLPAQSDKEKP